MAFDRTVHTNLPPRDAMLDPDAVAGAVVYALTQPPGTNVPTLSLERA